MLSKIKQLLPKLRLWWQLTWQIPQQTDLFEPMPEIRMKQLDWEQVAEALKKTLNAKIAQLGERKATVSLSDRPVAILWDLTDSTGHVIGCSLRASIMPNEAGLLVASLAINWMVMMDENFEFDAQGEKLYGEDALAYVFGQFYDKKRAEKLDLLETPSIGKLPN
jgi:hypothetical protein